MESSAASFKRLLTSNEHFSCARLMTNCTSQNFEQRRAHFGSPSNDDVSGSTTRSSRDRVSWRLHARGQTRWDGLCSVLPLMQWLLACSWILDALGTCRWFKALVISSNVVLASHSWSQYKRPGYRVVGRRWTDQCLYVVQKSLGCHVSAWGTYIWTIIFHDLATRAVGWAKEGRTLS